MSNMDILSQIEMCNRVIQTLHITEALTNTKESERITGPLNEAKAMASEIRIFLIDLFNAGMMWIPADECNCNDENVENVVEFNKFKNNVLTPFKGSSEPEKEN